MPLPNIALLYTAFTTPGTWFETQNYSRLPQACQRLLQAKRQSGLSFRDIGQHLGRDEVWVAALFYGQASPMASDLERLCRLLQLSTEALRNDFMSQDLMCRGSLIQWPTSDPALRPLAEVIQ
ncbi:Cyanate hydratase, partial [Dimargaris xerosporica]